MILIQPTDMLTHESISKAQFGKKNVIQTIFFVTPWWDGRKLLSGKSYTCIFKLLLNL